MSAAESPSPSFTTFELRNERSQIDAAAEHVITKIGEHGYPTAATFAIRLALEEAISNAFRHGHRDLPEETPVKLEVSVSPSRIELVVEDAGPGFTPSSVPDPRLDENLENTSGRGMLLMRSYMAKVDYEGRGNRVRMVYEPDAATGAK